MSLETEIPTSWIQRTLRTNMARLTDHVLKEKREGGREGRGRKTRRKEGMEKKSKCLG